jgi:hypothetical protein
MKIGQDMDALGLHVCWLEIASMMIARGTLAHRAATAAAT